MTATTEIRRATLFDLRGIQSLLTAARLPYGDIAGHLGGFLVAERDGRLVGAGGVESLGDAGLLRSLVIAKAHRGQGLGRELASALVADARARGLGDLYLLTPSPPGLFAGLGFAPVARDSVPAKVRGSREFALPGAADATVLGLRSQA